MENNRLPFVIAILILALLILPSWITASVMGQERWVGSLDSRGGITVDANKCRLAEDDNGFTNIYCY